MSAADPSELLAPKQVAAILDVKPRTVRIYIRERRLRAEWRGGWRVKREEVERFVAEATEAKLETGSWKTGRIG